MVLHGDHATGLEFDFGDADAVFDEENFLGAAVENFESAIGLGMSGVPVSGRLAKLFVLQEFNGDVLEGMVIHVARDVGEGGGEEASVSVGKRDGNGILAFDRVDDFGGAEGDIDVVVAVPVHQRVGMSRDFDVEDADVIVGKNLVVVRLGGDLHFRGGLGGEDNCQE